ncbi:hypothetical protein D9M73_116720 [compost metagenome]
MACGARRHRLRPALGGSPRDACILQHIAAPVTPEPDRDDPARIAAAPGLGPGGRIDRDHNAHQCRGRLHPRRVELRGGPQGPLDIGEHFARNLLPPQPRPAIGLLDRGQKSVGQKRILVRAPAGLPTPVQRHDPAQQWGRARRRRHHHLRGVAHPHSQHQIVPGRVTLAPFGEFVAPGGGMFGPAQFLGRARRKDRRARLGGELHFGAARAIADRFARPRHRDQPAFPLDHHAPHILDRRANQRDPRARHRARDLAHPFGTRPRLAETAPGADQPHPPRAGGRLLPLLRPALPAPIEFGPLRGGQVAQQGVAHARRQARELEQQRPRLRGGISLAHFGPIRRAS